MNRLLSEAILFKICLFKLLKAAHKHRDALLGTAIQLLVNTHIKIAWITQQQLLRFSWASEREFKWLWMWLELHPIIHLWGGGLEQQSHITDLQPPCDVIVPVWTLMNRLISKGCLCMPKIIITATLVSIELIVTEFLNLMDLLNLSGRKWILVFRELQK